MDTTRVQKPPYQRGRFRANQRNMRGRGGRGNSSQGGMQALGKGIKSRSDRDRKGITKKWGQGRVRYLHLFHCVFVTELFYPYINNNKVA